MNLDDVAYFQSIDTANLLGQIDGLPEQVQAAWALGQTLELPESHRAAKHILIAGMGTAATAGELAHALAAPESTRPITLLHNYALPAFVGPEALVIAASFSGDTEETLSACQAALRRGTKLLVITTGGPMAQLAEERRTPLWRFEHAGVPRTSLGWQFMLVLSALMKAGAVSDKSAEVAEAVEAVRAQQTALRADSPVSRNPAKRLAGQCLNRAVTVFASDYLAPVARRWAGLMAEDAKALAHSAELPEANHHYTAGTMFPEALIDKSLVLFLRSAHDHPRNRRRAALTRELYLTSGFNTDEVEARGASSLAQMLTALHYGDYVAYYLAMAYGVDPSPTPQIEVRSER